jgi:hypothetical protein
LIWYIDKTLVLMGNHTTKAKHLVDHDYYPSEILMIMKPSMNPIWHQMLVSISVLYVPLGSYHNIACRIYHLPIEQELWM